MVDVKLQVKAKQITVYKRIQLPFKRQSHKMAKHTQSIRRQIDDELFECVRPLY